MRKKELKNKNVELLVISPSGSKGIIKDIRSLIESARGRVATVINAELTLLYWCIGARIYKEILKEQRADYGKHIMPTLSAQLVVDYGMSFDVKNLWRMVQFAECFPDEKIVVTLSRQLSWSHFVSIS